MTKHTTNLGTNFIQLTKIDRMKLIENCTNPANKNKLQSGLQYKNWNVSHDIGSFLALCQILKNQNKEFNLIMATKHFQIIGSN